MVFTGIQTPNIDSLAAAGIRFVDATAHVPLTLPSHSSIHTGRFPSLHGVHDNGGFTYLRTRLDQHRQERFFLWTHFYDPHTPYEPPDEFDRMYPNRPYIAEIAYTDSVIGKLLKYLDTYQLR